MKTKKQYARKNDYKSSTDGIRSIAEDHPLRGFLQSSNRRHAKDVPTDSSERHTWVTTDPLSGRKKLVETRGQCFYAMGR